MAAVSFTPADLAPFADIPEAKAEAMIEDALALAARVAPCILDDGFEHGDAARAILRGAILRWHDSGSGAFTQQASGPFSVTMDNRQARKSMFYPSEIEQLQELCREAGGSARAFSVDSDPQGAGAGYWSAPDTWVPLT